MTEVIDLDSANAKNRDGDFVMNPFDTRQSDWLVIWFSWSRENWTESDVIRTFAFRRDCLLRGLDDIGLTLVHEPEISAFEKKNLRVPAMHEALDVKYHH